MIQRVINGSSSSTGDSYCCALCTQDLMSVQSTIIECFSSVETRA